MTKNHKIILTIALLSGVTIFSVFKYIVTLRENYALTQALSQARQQIGVLEKEKQTLLQTLEKELAAQKKLNQENLELKSYLKASKLRLIKLFKEYAQERKSAELLNRKFGILKLENKFLIKNRAELRKANDIFKLKLSSVEELRKTIREISSEMNSMKQSKLKGNRGFMIKDGKPTSSAKIKIEVIPVPKN